MLSPPIPSEVPINYRKRIKRRKITQINKKKGKDRTANKRCRQNSGIWKADGPLIMDSRLQKAKEKGWQVDQRGRAQKHVYSCSEA